MGPMRIMDYDEPLMQIDAVSATWIIKLTGVFIPQEFPSVTLQTNKWNPPSGTTGLTASLQRVAQNLTASGV